MLGQQGFWVCLVVGLIGAIGSAFTGHPLFALLTLCFFVLGGIGVREHSVTAAVILSLAYLISIVLVCMSGRPPGLLDIAICVILFTNIRGTYVASAWKRKSDPDLFPDRLNATFRDKLVDQWPPVFWPKGKFLFFAVSACYLAVLVLGLVAVTKRRAIAAAGARQITIQVDPPSQ